MLRRNWLKEIFKLNKSQRNRLSGNELAQKNVRSIIFPVQEYQKKFIFKLDQSNLNLTQNLIFLTMASNIGILEFKKQTEKCDIKSNRGRGSENEVISKEKCG